VLQLAHSKSFKKIKEASLEELKEIVGQAAAEKIMGKEESSNS
jgi:excinuclease UvrABC nuclease subunit